MNKKIFATLFFSIFAIVSGVGIVVPQLPVYAHNLGAGGLYMGSIFGAFSLSRTLFCPFSAGCRIKGGEPYIIAQAWFSE
jgi:DHA1 family multidrug resistance protein-like MFS transporter